MWRPGPADERAASQDDRPKWLVWGDGQQKWTADAVVLTCPAHQQAAVLSELDAELADKIGGIAYNRVAVVVLGYRQVDVPVSLDGFGFIAPQRTRRPCSAWSGGRRSSPTGRRPAQSCCVPCAAAGIGRRSSVGTMPGCSKRCAAELRLAMKITAAPILQRIVRWDRAIPQYLVGHLDRIAWIEQRMTCHPGLFLGGSAYRGVGLNDCTERATIVAGQVARYLV